MPISGLSGLRGLAIILIVAYHLNQVRSTENLALWDWHLYQFVALLPVVVSIFFILGGFLRSLSYWRVIFEGREIPDFWKGLKDRFLRIAPLFYLILILSFLWSLSLGNADWKSFFMGFTFFSWIHPDTFFPVAVNGPLWFVAYDMIGNIFVMVFMTLLISLRKKIPAYAGMTKSQVSVYAGMTTVFSFLLGIFVLLGLHYFLIGLPFPKGEGVISEWFPYYNPFIFGTYYLFGAGLAGLYLFFSQKGFKKSIIFDLVSVGLVFLIGYYLYSILGASDLAHSYPKSPYRYPLVPLLFGLMIFSILFSKYLASFLDNKTFLFFASISYPLYLTHALIIEILRHYIFGYAPIEHGRWGMFIIVVLTITIPLAYSLLKGEEWMMKKV